MAGLVQSFHNQIARQQVLARRMEIDFLVAKSKLARLHNVSAIEVKSGKRVRHASLGKFQAKFSDYLAEPFLFHAADTRLSGAMKYLPLYMVSCL